MTRLAAVLARGLAAAALAAALVSCAHVQELACVKQGDGSFVCTARTTPAPQPVGL